MSNAEKYKKYGNLMDLISRFGLPLNIHSHNTPDFYWWRAEYITADGTVVGTCFNDGNEGEFCKHSKDDLADYFNDIHFVKEYWDMINKKIEKPMCSHKEVNCIGDVYICNNCDTRMKPLGWEIYK